MIVRLPRARVLYHSGFAASPRSGSIKPRVSRQNAMPPRKTLKRIEGSEGQDHNCLHTSCPFGVICIINLYHPLNQNQIR